MIKKSYDFSRSVRNPYSTDRIARPLEPQPQAERVRFTNDYIIVELVDGRAVSVPLERFPRLSRATPKQLNNFEITADGGGIHWPELDEDLSVAGLLRDCR